jgi:hypothetical protein
MAAWSRSGSRQRNEDLKASTLEVQYAAGARRAQAIPGAVIKASRVRKTPSAIGARNDPSLTLEVEITSSSINATYVYICKPNPGHEAGLELIVIR